MTREEKQARDLWIATPDGHPPQNGQPLLNGKAFANGRPVEYTNTHPVEAMEPDPVHAAQQALGDARIDMVNVILRREPRKISEIARHHGISRQRADAVLLELCDRLKLVSPQYHRRRKTKKERLSELDSLPSMTADDTTQSVTTVEVDE